VLEQFRTPDPGLRIRGVRNVRNDAVALVEEFGSIMIFLGKTMGRASVALAISLQCLFAGSAAAQLDGVVTRGGGAPLEGVSVEAWSDDLRVGATMTDAQGRFSFPELISFSTVLLRAGALGFETREVVILDGLLTYEIELAVAPLAIEGLVVTMEEATCEDGREDDLARRLWEYARIQYGGLMDTLGVATYLSEADTVVPLSEFDDLQLPELNLSQRGSSSLLRFNWTRRIDREGYAFAIRRLDGAAPYDSWVYPPLEADFAPHFVDDAFGDRHRFVVDDANSDGWLLAYCPKDGGKPSIKGTITLARDTTFAAVDWIFETPEPLEHAGGRAYFPPIVAGSGPSYLLPSEAVIWRAIPTGDYLQSYQRYEDWRVAPGDSVPLLPLRREGTGADVSR
jgi:hypothetical protein